MSFKYTSRHHGWSAAQVPHGTTYVVLTLSLLIRPVWLSTYKELVSLSQKKKRSMPQHSKFVLGPVGACMPHCCGQRLRSPTFCNLSWSPSAEQAFSTTKGGVWFGLGQRLPRTPRATVSATVPARPDWVGRFRLSRSQCPTADSPQTPWWHMREGDTIVPVCVACALLGCLWVGGGGACGVVCRLVLQVPAGRQWAPDTKPAGGVVGLDTPPQGQLTCRWPPRDCLGHRGG